MKKYDIVLVVLVFSNSIFMGVIYGPLILGNNLKINLLQPDPNTAGVLLVFFGSVAMMCYGFFLYHLYHLTIGDEK